MRRVLAVVVVVAVLVPVAGGGSGVASQDAAGPVRVEPITVADAVDASIVLSQRWVDDASSTEAVLARGDSLADLVVATRLVLQRPLLLLPEGLLEERVLAELRRTVTPGRVYRDSLLALVVGAPLRYRRRPWRSSARPGSGSIGGAVTIGSRPRLRSRK